MLLRSERPGRSLRDAHSSSALVIQYHISQLKKRFFYGFWQFKFSIT